MPSMLCATLLLTTLPGADVARTVERVAEVSRPALAVVTVEGRDGNREGLGTGFFVGESLIVTNLHVIGEARPIKVESPEGKAYRVTGVHATDRTNDLAVLEVAREKGPSLELGAAKGLKDGQTMVALGNPQGLKASVVSGVVSGQREIEGRSMIQLAIPLEPGNSGGPLLDLDGRVCGVVTMKSAITANLGFAIPVEAVKSLLARPNPVAIDRWLTIGALDPDEWTPIGGGARWRQRAGRLLVEGAGSGFGGRSLCLSASAAPIVPFELSVAVKLDDERGAAGLALYADGEDRHVGFYPTGGQLRLTRFEGPDVFAWQILQQKPSPAYRANDWNVLKVRAEKDRLLCYVNDVLAMEQAYDFEAAGPKIGVVKFRDTKAEFKAFRFGAKLPSSQPTEEVVKRISESIDELDLKRPAPAAIVEKLAKEGANATELLRARARLLERQAEQLRELAARTAHRRTLADLEAVAAQPDDQIDLIHAALLIARLDNEELDVEAYRRDVQRLATKLKTSLPKGTDAAAKVDHLNRFLFAERGFHGSRGDYYNRSNSYLNEVLDDREGLPITLAVLYIELGRQLGLPLTGAPLPGHFVVKHTHNGQEEFLDAFDGGKRLSADDVARTVRNFTGGDVKPEHTASASKRSILTRMLTNLLGIARSERDIEGALRYLDGIVSVDPEAANERWMRAVLRFELGRREGIEADLRWLLDKEPDGIDLDKVDALRRRLEQPE